VFDQFLSPVINALLALPPIRFIMGLVESQWRPLWATLWIAVIVYLMSRTMNQLALRRARLGILNEPIGGLPTSVLALADESQGSGAAPRREPTPTVAAPIPDSSAPTVPPTPPGPGTASIPVSVVAGAVVVGAIVVASVALFTRSAPNGSTDSLVRRGVAPLVDTTAHADAPIDLRLRSGRMDGDNCIGTFEVTHGVGARARLVAFAMDTSGAVIARDSAQVASAVTGMFVDFRFRNVDCDEIDDWQIQATTSPQPAR